jgi:RHS repeat-associated protein
VGQFTAAGTGLSGSAAYEPFGKVTASTAMQGSLGFQSEWTDAQTKRVNMHARWYSPDTGQFDSRDTAGVPNRHSYAGNNPLTTQDPTGHWDTDGSWDFVGGFGTPGSDHPYGFVGGLPQDTDNGFQAYVNNLPRRAATRAFQKFLADLGGDKLPDCLRKMTKKVRGQLDALCEMAGIRRIRRIRFHDLRHSTATLLLEQGVELVTIKDLLGHAQIYTTADTYPHVRLRLQRDAIEAMGNALDPGDHPATTKRLIGEGHRPITKQLDLALLMAIRSNLAVEQHLPWWRVRLRTFDLVRELAPLTFDDGVDQAEFGLKLGGFGLVVNEGRAEIIRSRRVGSGRHRAPTPTRRPQS